VERHVRRWMGAADHRAPKAPGAPAISPSPTEGASPA